MALLPCPECRREVSSRAAACPNCGCPLSAVGVSGSAGTPIAGSPQMSPVELRLLEPGLVLSQSYDTGKDGLIVDDRGEHLLRDALLLWRVKLSEITFIRCSSLGEQHFEMVSQLPDVSVISLMECHTFDDFQLRTLAKTRTLRKLSIFDSPLITDAGLGNLRTAGALQELHLTGEMKRITPQGVRALKQSLPHCKISDGVVRW